MEVETPWNRVLLETLIVNSVMKCSYFREPEGSLLSSQGPAIGPYPEKDESSPHLSTLILSSYLCEGLQSGLFPSGFPSEILYAFLISVTCATSPAYLILDLFTLTIFGEAYRL